MKKVKWIISAILLLVACKENKESAIPINPHEQQFTDSIYFDEVGATLFFENQNLFDTSYYTFQAAMCSHGITSGYRYSNTNYDCTDSFEFMHPITLNDTALTLTFHVNKKSYKSIDSSQYEVEISLAKILRKARGSNMVTLTTEIGQLKSFSFISITYNDTLSNGLVNLNKTVLFAQDSTTLELKLNCFAKNCDGKLNDFNALLESISIRN